MFVNKVSIKAAKIESLSLDFKAKIREPVP